MPRAQCAVHGFRTMFRGWVVKVDGAHREVCEAALAHAELETHLEPIRWRRRRFVTHDTILAQPRSLLPLETPASSSTTN